MLSDEYQYITESSDLPSIAAEIESAVLISLDLETTGLHPIKGAQIRLCSINTGRSVYVIDCFKTNGLGPVANALHISKGIKLGFNLKFDQKFLLYYYGVELWPVYDPFRASRLMWNGKTMEHNLWAVQEREINKRPRTDDLGGSDWTGELAQQQKDYAADDVISLPEIREAQKPKLAALGLNRVALIEFGALLPECAVELNGFKLNSNDWSILAHKSEIRRKELRQQLWDIMPDPNNQMALPFGKKLSFFNLDSPEQMLRSLKLMGLSLEDTKEVTLAMLASEYPIINSILDYREKAQRVKSFGLDYLEYIDPTTGRIHPEYHGFLKAGRYSCARPNLAQIPRDKAFRSCFQSEEGNQLVLADYSGIEMRIVAEEANDKNLLKVFSDHKDVHKVTASILLNLSYDEIDKSKKQQAKPVNFGFCIAEGQNVLTNCGLIPIESVKNWHFVWDGVEWVSHSGVKYMGEREVISYDGLIATPDHEVYTQDGFKISFGEAASTVCARSLAIGAVDNIPVRYDEFDRKNRTNIAEPTRCRDDALTMLQVKMDISTFKSETNNLFVEYKEQRIRQRTYDIVNAGPRHRFTVEGKIVSNCYGMMPPKLVLYAKQNYGVTMSPEQAVDFRKKYMNYYSGIPKWHRKALAEGKKSHMSYNSAGRLRHLDEDAYNEILNNPIQSLGADGLKAALRNVYFRLKKVLGYSPVKTKIKTDPKIRMIHHVHDEIILEVKDDDDGLIPISKKELIAGMKEGMQQFLKKVDVEIDAMNGKTWAEK